MLGLGVGPIPTGSEIRERPRDYNARTVATLRTAGLAVPAHRTTEPVGSPVRTPGLVLGADGRCRLVGPRRLAGGPAGARRAPPRRLAARGPAHHHQDGSAPGRLSRGSAPGGGLRETFPRARLAGQD